ncbi:hypothetical protein SAMN04487781_0194 [Cellulosimicrobium cellulans]|nr:hypothetical protein SAMN04487781_0194 [Cellulosimicrobium cellulans]
MTPLRRAIDLSGGFHPRADPTAGRSPSASGPGLGLRGRAGGVVGLDDA